MKRSIRIVFVGVAAGVLLATTGCFNSSHQPIQVQGQNPSGTSASTPASSTALTRPKQQQVVLDGVIVTMLAPVAGAPASAGRYEIHLQAMNSTTATMSLPVVGNPPHLVDAQGRQPADAVTGSGFGPGAHPTKPGAIPEKVHVRGLDGIPPHTWVNGLIVTKYNPADRGLSVVWNLGQGRLAQFKL